MRTLEELRHSLASARDMQSVVVTMKTLAAATIRQYEAAADATGQYDEIIQKSFQVLLRDPHSIYEKQSRWSSVACDPFEALMGDSRDTSSQPLLVVFGTDQGLCGRFNEEISTHVQKFVEARHAGLPLATSPSAIAVGARVVGFLEELEIEVVASFSVPTTVPDISGLLQNLLPELDKWTRRQDSPRVNVFFNRRTSTASYEPFHQQLLPPDREYLEQIRARPWYSRSLPVYRLPRQTLISGVVQQYLYLQLYRAIAESRASENASRIASMQQAEKNIEEKLSELNTRFNQQRQDSITEELLDIMSGFSVAQSNIASNVRDAGSGPPT